MTTKPKKLTAEQRSANARLAGLKGGQARAKKLTAEQRSAIARLGGLKGGPARAKKLTAEQRSANSRLGGLKSAQARAKKLTAEQCSTMAKKAAKARWYPCEKHTNNIIINKYIKTVRNQITYFDNVLREKSNNLAIKAKFYPLKWEYVQLLEYLVSQKK